jgi:hypothetical protein
MYNTVYRLTLQGAGAARTVPFAMWAITPLDTNHSGNLTLK